jgi:hypothetical protein
MPHTSFFHVALGRTMPFSPVPIRLHFKRFCVTSSPCCLHSRLHQPRADRPALFPKQIHDVATASSRILVTSLSRYGFGGAVRRCVLRF